MKKDFVFSCPDLLKQVLSLFKEWYRSFPIKRRKVTLVRQAWLLQAQDCPLVVLTPVCGSDGDGGRCGFISDAAHSVCEPPLGILAVLRIRTYKYLTKHSDISILLNLRLSVGAGGYPLNGFLTG